MPFLFVVTKLDRLARTVGDLLAIVARLEVKGVSLRVLSISGNQPLDTNTATGRLMLAVIGAAGQAEREAMLERQREGIARAKAQHRCKGREPTARRQSGEIVRLKRRLAAQPPGLFPRGATGTVTNVGGVGPLDGEIPVWVKMDQHFQHLAREDNQLLVKSSEIADAAKGRWVRLWVTWRGE